MIDRKLKARIIELLKIVEWSDEAVFCPCCHAAAVLDDGTDHDDDCDLGIMLKELGENSDD